MKAGRGWAAGQGLASGGGAGLKREGEKVRPSQPYDLRDTARRPVVDARHAQTSVVTQLASEFGGAAEVLDESCIGMFGRHGRI